MRRILSGCCAIAVSGHAAATPNSVMNSRRIIRGPRRPLRATWADGKRFFTWRPHSRQRNIELAITWTPEPSARDDLDIEILFDGRHILMGFLVGGQLPLNQL
jgi:hypothetical protein